MVKILNLLLGSRKNTLSNHAICYYSDILNQTGGRVLSVVHPDSSAISELVKLPIKLKTIKPSLMNMFFENEKLNRFTAEFEPDVIIAYDEPSYNLVKNYKKAILVFSLSSHLSKIIKCDAVLYNNPHQWKTQRLLIKLRNEHSHIHFPIDSTIIYSNLNKRKKDTNVITFGIKISQSFDHDINLVLKAFSIVSRNNNSFRLIISNMKKRTKELPNLIRNYKLLDHVSIDTHNNFSNFLSILDAYLICPYQHINMLELCNVINEGVPAIVPNDSDIHDTLVHGINGLIYQKSDVDALAEMIEKIIKYPSYISEISSSTPPCKRLRLAKNYMYNLIEELTINSVELV